MQTYDAVTAVGVISPNHAGPKTIIHILSLIKTNGIIVFSLNDHAINDIRFSETIKNLLFEKKMT